MRLLLEDHANDVMDKIDEILKDTSLNPFMYHTQNTRILSGEEEGAFAWITVNYLKGFFQPGNTVSGVSNYKPWDEVLDKLWDKLWEKNIVIIV